MDSETSEWPKCDLCQKPVDPTNSIGWQNKTLKRRICFNWECFGDWGRKRRLRQSEGQPFTLSDYFPDDGTMGQMPLQ